MVVDPRPTSMARVISPAANTPRNASTTPSFVSACFTHSLTLVRTLQASVTIDGSVGPGDAPGGTFFGAGEFHVRRSQLSNGISVVAREGGLVQALGAVSFPDGLADVGLGEVEDLHRASGLGHGFDTAEVGAVLLSEVCQAA